MESSVKRTQRDYTLAFKLAVVEQVEKGELTYKEAQQKYGIQGRSTVLVWLRKHGRLGWGPAASSHPDNTWCRRVGSRTCRPSIMVSP